MGKREPYDSFITVHQCIDGFLIEYPDNSDNKKLVRQVVSDEDEVESAKKMIIAVLELFGFDANKAEANLANSEQQSGIGFKINKK
jgi:hypothetical protein